MQRDLKRLLADSTIENAGIVFIGLGLALAFKANGMAAAAGLASQALLHWLNHSLFKSLLFFGAGAVLSTTAQRDIQGSRGPHHMMPQTMPIRRLPGVFNARDMPLPGDARPARLAVTLRDLPWDATYVSIAEVIWFAAEKLNHLQFLTIGKYLDLVSARRTDANGCAMALSTYLFVPATIGFPNGGGAA